MTASAIFADGLLDGRHVLVTGGGTGIGLAIARECGRLGARVTLAARRENVLAEACAARSSSARNCATAGKSLAEERAPVTPLSSEPMRNRSTPPASFARNAL